MRIIHHVERERDTGLLALPVLFLSDRALGRMQGRRLSGISHARSLRERERVKSESEKSSAPHSVLITTPTAGARSRQFSQLTLKSCAGCAEGNEGELVHCYYTILRL